MTIQSSASLPQRWTNRKGQEKSRIAGTTTPAPRVIRTTNFRRAYFQPIMKPLHVDTASASAVAAKKIFTGSALDGAAACAGF
jgi:hypothetical protein